MNFFINNHHSLPAPKRIISLVPSQTELLFHLNLEQEVVGITKFCVHPEAWFRSKTRVGGTKTVNFNKVKALEPDLIIANKEENTKEQIEALSQLAPVFVTEIYDIPDALAMIKTIGDITQRASIAKDIAQKIETSFGVVQDILANKSVLYFIWRQPWMSIGNHTFIDAVLRHLGCNNVCRHLERYPELRAEKIKELNPEIVMLSSEPYPFKDLHIAELKELLPQAQIILVDGEMFSWYGSRLLLAPDYFMQLSTKFG